MTGLIFMKLHSERVPGKNLRDVGGKPLFFWIFEALAKSSSVGDVILNTDSELIAQEVSSRFEVIVHMRPEELLGINSNEANQLIEHDIMMSMGEYFLQTHSTNPLLSSDTIERAVDTYFGKALPSGCDSLLSVTAHHKRFFTADGRPVNHDPSSLVKTQHLPPLLEENSCLYLFSRQSFFANGCNRLGSKPFFFPIRATEAIDLDEEDDVVLADALLRARDRAAS